MGKTYRYENEWGRRPPKRRKVKRQRGNKKVPLNNDSNQLASDELKIEAYEEELYTRYSKKDSGGF